MSGPGWWVCRNCGLANKIDSRHIPGGCIGCFRLERTGAFDVSLATTAVMILSAVYFLCALIGLLGGFVVALIPAELLFGAKRDVVYHDFLLVAGGGAGVALGLRIAWNDWVSGQRKQGPVEPLPVPPMASPLRRHSDLIAHLGIGAIFTTFTFGFWIEKWLKGYGSDVKEAALAGLVLLGAAGGWVYFRYKRR